MTIAPSGRPGINETGTLVGERVKRAINTYRATSVANRNVKVKYH